MTEGYGTTHLSDDTVAALRELSEKRRGGRYVNNLFGEGTSPRLRQTREGLEELNLNADALIQHNTPRRVYAIELFDGARDVLTLNRASGGAERPFRDVAAAWRRRWLANRVTFVDALTRTAAQGPNTVRQDLASPNQRQLTLFEPSRVRQPEPTSQESAMRGKRTSSNNNLPLIESLYRALGACAETAGSACSSLWNRFRTHHGPISVAIIM